MAACSHCPEHRVFAVRIREENARPGTRSWWEIQHAPGRAIEGYTTQTSVLPGGRLELCVGTEPAARYSITIYRLGWYDGQGGREIMRLPSNAGVARPMAEPEPTTGRAAADWPVTAVAVVPTD